MANTLLFAIIVMTIVTLILVALLLWIKTALTDRLQEGGHQRTPDISQ